MAEHEVRFRIPWRDLGKSDVIFTVRQEGNLLGTLKISKGAVVWVPGNAKRGYEMEWIRFDKAMRSGRRGIF